MSLLTFEHFQNHGHFVNPRVGEKQVCPAMVSNAQTTVDLHNHQYATNFLLHLEEASSLTSIVRLPFPPSFDYIDNKYYFTPEFACGNMCACGALLRRSYVDEAVQELNPLSACFESSVTALELLLSEDKSGRGAVT